MLEVSDKEEGIMGLKLPIEPFKNPLWVGAGSEMRTQYLSAHCAIAAGMPICV